MKIKINFEDEEFKETLHLMLSGLLPHDKNLELEDSYFSGRADLLGAIFNLVDVDEFDNIYYILFKNLQQFEILNGSYFNHKISLTREVFISLLETNLYDLFRKRSYLFMDWLSMQGIETDLNMHETVMSAISVIGKASLELYDECFLQEKVVSDALSYIETFKAQLQNNLINNSLKFQTQILNNQFRIGKKYFTGGNGWVEYMQTLLYEITARFNKEIQTFSTVDSLEKIIELNKTAQESHIPIHTYGIPEMDEQTPISSKRFVVTVGDAGTGKTTFYSDVLAGAAFAGKKVAVFYADGDESTYFFDFFLPSYIRKMTDDQIRLSAKQLLNRDKLPSEIQKIIALAETKIAKDGCFNFINSLSYKNLGNELIQLYNKINYDIIVIDHFFSLDGEMPEKDKVSLVSQGCMLARKKIPSFLWVIGHPNAAVRDTLLHAKDITKLSFESNLVAESSASFRDVDEMYLLFQTKSMRDSGVVGITSSKRRRGERLKPTYIQMLYAKGGFVYDIALQHKWGASINDEDLDSLIDSSFDEEEED